MRGFKNPERIEYQAVNSFNHKWAVSKRWRCNRWWFNL